MQILLFDSAPESAAERAAAAFFQTIDYALLAEQRRWLRRTTDRKEPTDRAGRRLLRFIDNLREAFSAQGGELDKRRQYWKGVSEMKQWLLTRLDGGHAQESPGMGLLHLLDAVQDFATDTLGVPEHWVFPGLRVTMQQELSYSQAA